MKLNKSLEPRVYSAQQISDLFRSSSPMPLQYIPVVDYNTVLAYLCYRLKEAEKILYPFGGYEGYQEVNEYFEKYQNRENPE